VDQRLVEAAARTFAELERLQQEVLGVLDRAQEVAPESLDRLRAAEQAHDAAQAALDRHLDG
jgi:hypothetical protein